MRSPLVSSHHDFPESRKETPRVSRSPRPTSRRASRKTGEASRPGTAPLFGRILVPLDFTPRNHRAVRMAGRLAEASGAEVLLLHGIERIDDGRIGGLRGFYRRLEKSAREKMRPYLAALERRGVRAGAEILYGRVVAEILDFAVERDVDLIVLSSHTVGPEQGWSTTSYKVGILSRCPVLLVK